MRIVIDTNVFISSFFGGKPKQVTDLWKNGAVELCMSKDILEEYVEVLSDFGLGHSREIEDLLSLFTRGFNMIWVFNPPNLCVVREDPDDDKFIECAVGGKCSYVVTGDKALRNVNSFQNIQMVTPAEFLVIGHTPL